MSNAFVYLGTSKIHALSVMIGLTFTIARVQAEETPTEVTPQEEVASPRLEAASNQFIRDVDRYLRKRSEQQREGVRLLGVPDDVIIPGTGSDGFPQDPSDGPLDPVDTGNPTDQGTDYPGTDYPVYDDSNYPYPVFNRRSGAAERLALETLYQTLNFYGVVHIVEKTGTRIEFKILKSKNGYFTSLTKLDIAYAVREFARYITAHLCNDGSADNFYKVFAQVSDEEIGLRFKYDMAWALLGNMLPKEPNSMMKLGTRWAALNQILNGGLFKNGSTTEENKEIKGIVSTMGELVGFLGRMNKMMCYVDIRPVPKDELKKRVVIHKFLEMEKRLNERYGALKDILKEVEKEGKKAQLSSLQEPVIQK